jgi:hypothetical protein
VGNGQGQQGEDSLQLGTGHRDRRRRGVVAVGGVYLERAQDRDARTLSHAHHLRSGGGSSHWRGTLLVRRSGIDTATADREGMRALVISLAALGAVLGAMADSDRADPIIGLAISAAIINVLRVAARDIYRFSGLDHPHPVER